VAVAWANSALHLLLLLLLRGAHMQPARATAGLQHRWQAHHHAVLRLGLVAAALCACAHVRSLHFRAPLVVWG
jgi:hypothetical protein